MSFSVNSVGIAGDKGYFSYTNTGLYCYNIQPIGSFTTGEFKYSSTAIYKIIVDISAIITTTLTNDALYFLSSTNYTTGNNATLSNGYIDEVNGAFVLTSSTSVPVSPAIVAGSLNGPSPNLYTNAPLLKDIFNSATDISGSPTTQAGFYNNNGLCNFCMYFIGGQSGTNGFYNDIMRIEMYAVLSPNTTYYLQTFVGQNATIGSSVGYDVNGTYEYWRSYP